MFVVGLLVMMSAWGGTYALKNMTLVFVVAGFWGLGFNVVSQQIGWNKVTKLEEMFIASPVKLYELYLGVVVGSSPFALSNLVPSAILLFYIGLVDVLPYLWALGLIALLLGSFFGLAIVLRIKTPTNISAITNPLNALMTLIPLVYYPATLLPNKLGFALSLAPTATLMELARGLIGLPTVLTPLQATAVTTAWLVLAAASVIRVMKWGLE